MKSLVYFVVAAATLFFPVYAQADTVTYTFDAPNFVVGSATPIVGSPNSGPAGFQATFTAAPEAGAFTIQDSGQPNPLITGQYLTNTILVNANNTLTVTLNTPITSVSVNFGIQILFTSPGQLVLTSPVGGTSQASALIPGAGLNQGGVLTFSTTIPFTSFTLAAFNNFGQPTRFAIDDLVMETASAGAVPEPATIFLLSAGLVGAVFKVRRRNQNL
jgi:PEP-CTERM motif-containing protein